MQRVATQHDQTMRLAACTGTSGCGKGCAVIEESDPTNEIPRALDPELHGGHVLNRGHTGLDNLTADSPGNNCEGLETDTREATKTGMDDAYGLSRAGDNSHQTVPVSSLPTVIHQTSTMILLAHITNTPANTGCCCNGSVPENDGQTGAEGGQIGRGKVYEHVKNLERKIENEKQACEKEGRLKAFDHNSYASQKGSQFQSGLFYSRT